MIKITNCDSHLAGLIDIEQNYKKLSVVKTESLLNVVKPQPSIDATYLVIGSNIVPMGLAEMGAKVTTWYGLPFSHNNITAHDGDLEDFIANSIQFDYVIAPDEWLTKADTEEDQKQKISIVSRLARVAFITTLKDYKNMFSNQRIFEEPFILRTDKSDAIIVRKRAWDYQDKQSWIQQNYLIYNEELYGCEPNRRRTMYFKQLAKFCSDAGARDFYIEKQNMYKGAFSKTFEYVVCVKF